MDEIGGKVKPWMVTTVHHPSKTGFRVPAREEWVWVRDSEDGAWDEYYAVQRLRKKELRGCGCVTCLAELRGYSQVMPMITQYAD